MHKRNHYNNTPNRLVIDLLVMERHKSYGFQEYILNLLGYFHRHREDVLFDKIVIICKRGEESLFAEYSRLFDIVSYPYQSYLKRLWIQTMFPIWLKLKEHDVLLSPGNYTGLIKRCPTVLVIHDLLYKRKGLLKNRMMRYQRELFVPYSIRNADKVIAISKYTADDIRHYYPWVGDKICVVHNYLDFLKFSTTPSTSKGLYLLAVSSNQYHKNLHTLIRAYGMYADVGGELPLLLVGVLDETTPAGKVYEQLPEPTRKRVIFRADISNEELGKLYQNAACYVSASLFEGLGMPIAEAMYFNLPVLISDGKVFREVSLGRGRYFNPLNADELCKLLLGVDGDKCNYSKDIITMFSEEKTSAKYVDIINNSATGGGNIDDAAALYNQRRAA